MPPLKRILVAEGPRGVKFVQAALGASALIFGTNSLPEAEGKLEEGVDLVICGLHFDEGRMFDFLRLAKANPAVKAVPFICIHTDQNRLGKAILESIEIASAALGSEYFVDVGDLEDKLGATRATEEFQSVLRPYLS